MVNTTSETGDDKELLELLEDDSHISTVDDLESSQSVFIYAPDHLPGISATAKSIMDELKDRHRRVEKQTGKEAHPSFLLTLDKIPESLHKYTNLPAQGKSEASIASAIREILDLDKKGENRIAYLYPFLIRDGNRISAKIALIGPQVGNSKTDVSKYRQACFKNSQEIIDLILENRAKKPRVIDDDQPGKPLLQMNKSSMIWLYPNLLSIESEMNSLLRKSFQPFPYIPCGDFINDFVKYGLIKSRLIRIQSDYHLILDEIELDANGTYKKAPELINHYRALVDALEKFSLDYLKKLCIENSYMLFIQKLEAFEKEYIMESVPGKRQSSEKAEALISLIEEFPFDSVKSKQLGMQVRETCFSAIHILKNIMKEKGNLLIRKNESILKSIESMYLEKIPEFTKNENRLMPLHIVDELKQAGIQDEESIHLCKERILQTIQSRFTVVEDDQDNQQLYAVDQGYLASVIHKLTSLSIINKSYKPQLALVKKIHARLIQENNPRLNEFIKPDHVLRLSNDTRSMEKAEEQKAHSEEWKKHINPVVAFFSFFISLVSFFTGSFIFDSTSLLIFGVPISFVIGGLAGFLMKERKHKKPGKSDVLDTVTHSGLSEKSEAENPHHHKKNEQEEKLNAISRVAEKYLFGGKFNKITDKIYDQKKLKIKIREILEDIRREVPALAKETDHDKVLSAIEYAVIQNSIIINIPEDIVPKNRPHQLIMSKNDFRSQVLRQDLAEYYRMDAEKNKHDDQLIRYYKFLINTLEIEYYKYLPKKIR